MSTREVWGKIASRSFAIVMSTLVVLLMASAANAQPLPADCTDGDPAYFENHMALDDAVGVASGPEELEVLFDMALVFDPPTAFEDFHRAYLGALHYLILAMETGNQEHLEKAQRMIEVGGELAESALTECGMVPAQSPGSI